MVTSHSRNESHPTRSNLLRWNLAGERRRAGHGNRALAVVVVLELEWQILVWILEHQALSATFPFPSILKRHVLTIKPTQRKIQKQRKQRQRREIKKKKRKLLGRRGDERRRSGSWDREEKQSRSNFEFERTRELCHSILFLSFFLSFCFSLNSKSGGVSKFSNFPLSL